MFTKQNLDEPFLETDRSGSKSINDNSPVRRSSSSTNSDILCSPKRSLTNFEIFAFSVGHVMNDMCAAAWFTYLLYFLEDTIGLCSISAGLVMLSGQFADGVFTPIAGLVSDKTKPMMTVCGVKMCKRTIWHFNGTILVSLCFSAVWMYSPFGDREIVPNDPGVVAYYAIGAALFNVGWASTQVAHMALVTDLSNDSNVRTLLTAYRNAGTITANVLVYICYLFLLQYLYPPQQITKSLYLYLGVFVLSVGLLLDVVFYRGMHLVGCANEEETQRNLLDDPKNINEAQDVEESVARSSGVRTQRMTNWGWLKTPQFYNACIIYMNSRAVVNIIMVYIAFYLQTTLKVPESSLAIVPLVMYLVSFVITLLYNSMSKCLGSLATFWIGALLCCVGGLLTEFVVGFYLSTDWVYLTAVILGAGSAIILTDSLAKIAHLVGDNTDTSAFVYGIMSLGDKFYSGLIVILIQNHREAVCGESDVGASDGGASATGLLTQTISAVKLLMIPYLQPLLALSSHQSSSSSSSPSSELQPVLDDTPVECEAFVRQVFAFVPMGCALIAAVAVIFFRVPKKNRRRG